MEDKQLKSDPKRLEQAREWRDKNRDKVKAANNAYRERNKEARNEQCRQWRDQQSRDTLYNTQLASNQRLEAKRLSLRIAIFRRFESQCFLCGFSDIRALQIDHVNGGGTKERRTTNNMTYLKNILASVESGQKDYVVLCANCHQIKHSSRAFQDIAALSMPT